MSKKAWNEYLEEQFAEYAATEDEEDWDDDDEDIDEDLEFDDDFYEDPI